MKGIAVATVWFGHKVGRHRSWIGQIWLQGWNTSLFHRWYLVTRLRRHCSLEFAPVSILQARPWSLSSKKKPSLPFLWQVKTVENSRLLIWLASVMQGREYPCPLLVSLLLYSLFFSYLPPISLWLVPAFAACASGKHICYREMLSISQSLVESAELPSIVQYLHQILQPITQWTNKPWLPQGGVEDWCFVVAMVRRG